MTCRPKFGASDNLAQTGGEDDGLVHARPLEIHDTETLCGHAMVGGGVRYHDTAEQVTCPMCRKGLAQAAQLLARHGYCVRRR